MATGILAFQGCIKPHVEILGKLGEEVLYVKSSEQLGLIDRLILPGGESTTMLKLICKAGIFSELVKFGQNKPVWGICAGAILIASEVVNPSQESLGLIGIKAHRNYYGSQINSFETEILLNGVKNIEKLRVKFIRAPKFETTGEGVEVLAEYKGYPVMVRQGNILASAFHTELDTDALHRWFIEEF